MSISYSMTARDIITNAILDRLQGIGLTVKAKEVEYAQGELNRMLKTWASRGLTLWTDENGTAEITAGSPDVALVPRPLEVFSVSLSVSATYARPLARWEKGDYTVLPNKQTVGEPSIYTPVYAASGVSIRVWPVPATDRAIAYSYSRVIEDVTELSDPIDVPQAWLDTVQKCLAARLDRFGGDPNHVIMLKQEAARLEQRMFDYDRPSSYTIVSDCYG